MDDQVGTRKNNGYHVNKGYFLKYYGNLSENMIKSLHNVI